MTDSTTKEGIHLFNARIFFEAHEVLETVWLKAEGDDKIFLHGLIQVAAGFHHQSRENVVGVSLAAREGFSKTRQVRRRAHGRGPGPIPRRASALARVP